MTDIAAGLQTLGGNYTITDARAFEQLKCAECGALQHLVVGRTAAADRFWLRCVNCKAPSVVDRGRVWPGTRALSAPLGVTGIELDVWNEVRDCLAVGANTAAVMLARKLLLHIAVAQGLPEKNEKGWAPTFAEAVSHLENADIITKRMVPWVERIKDVGNEANHEITPISASVALDVATFMEQLLKLAYEMEALMAGVSVE